MSQTAFDAFLFYRSYRESLNGMTQKDQLATDACRKIFGERTPGIYELADFFGQIGALIKKYGDERVEGYKEKYAKYDKKEG